MSFKWRKELIESFIAFYQEHECLYNVSSSEYVNRQKKADAYNVILNEMQKLDAVISMDDLKKKWKGLRTQFLQEFRLINSSKKSGAGVEEIYKPKLWCFEELSFLQIHTQMRPSSSNIKCEDYDQPSTSKKASTSEKTANSSKVTAATFKKDFDAIKELIHQKKSKQKFDWLGKQVTEQIEELDEEDQPNAVWEIQNILNKYWRAKIQNSRHTSTSSAQPASPTRDILEMSMDGVFDVDDFEIM